MLDLQRLYNIHESLALPDTLVPFGQATDTSAINDYSHRTVLATTREVLYRLDKAKQAYHAAIISYTERFIETQYIDYRSDVHIAWANATRCMLDTLELDTSKHATLYLAKGEFWKVIVSYASAPSQHNYQAIRSKAEAFLQVFKTYLD